MAGRETHVTEDISETSDPKFEKREKPTSVEKWGQESTIVMQPGHIDGDATTPWNGDSDLVSARIRYGRCCIFNTVLRYVTDL